MCSLSGNPWGPVAEHETHRVEPEHIQQPASIRHGAYEHFQQRKAMRRTLAL
jgi:hypothetical protein